MQRTAIARERVEAILAAQEDERRRLGRALHDGTGQELTAALLSLRVIENRIRGGQRDAALAEAAALQELLTQAVLGVRRLSSLLAPPVLTELGLVRAIEQLARLLCEPAGLDVAVDATGDVDGVPERIAIELYRIAQSTLSAVAELADASRVVVSLDRDGDEVVLVVAEDGREVDAGAAAGIGPDAIHERLELLGGSLGVASRDGGGTIVTTRVPLA